MDQQIGAKIAVMRISSWVKTQMSCKAMLSIYQLIFIPTFIHGHEIWAVSERQRYEQSKGVSSIEFLHFALVIKGGSWRVGGGSELR